MARLARLDLPDETIAVFQRDLNQILEAAATLQYVDTEGVEPTAHAAPSRNVVRADTVEEGLPREKVLSNGPEIVDGYFRVPRIMEE